MAGELDITRAIAPEGVVFRASSGGAPMPPAAWATGASPLQVNGMAALLAAVETDLAREIDGGIIASHAWAAGLSAAKARSLGLPPTSSFILDIDNEGTFDRPDFAFRVKWRRPNGQPILGPVRIGAFLEVAGDVHRLPRAVFDLIEAVDRFNTTPAEDIDGRRLAWAVVQDLLPREAIDAIRVSGYLRQTRIVFPTSFSLDVGGTIDDVDLDPVLHAARSGSQLSEGAEPSAEDPATLLPPDYQRRFARERFRAFQDVRASYALGEGWYVVLPERIRRALGVVRRVQAGPVALRREFLANPRVYLRDALDDEDEAFVESILVETSAYSDRVRAIGLWQPKVLPWVKIARASWLPPEEFGLVVDGKKVHVTSDQLKALRDQVARAIERADAFVTHRGEQIPATGETLNALDDLSATLGLPTGSVEPTGPMPQGDGQDSTGRERSVLLIAENIADTDLFEARFERRSPEIAEGVPDLLTSALKPHQWDGLRWLQQAWQIGRPGVLLADDMGLGKTLQALAFLAWVKQGLARAGRPRAPVLIVAPTGLLANWEAEHDRHLTAPGLGQRLAVHGAGLKAVRVGRGRDILEGRPLLDIDRLKAADWVLTTYETLRDYQHSFCQVPFAAVIYDEAQKIKNPGAQATLAAKAVKAGFSITMTGTPVENRLADLWCIVDTSHPGLLGDLKRFSNTYETTSDPSVLGQLKEQLSRARPGRPHFMMRRLKKDALEALPPKSEHVLEIVMPDAQAQAYLQAVADVRGGKSRGAMLAALHKLRSLSLYAREPDGIDDEAYIALSARLAAAFAVLDKVAAAGEKALIFLEFLDVQPVLAALIQRRYRLSAPPLIISGDVAGTKRQARVKAFQEQGAGFDAMILSPRAGGVGLTLTAANHVIHLTRWWNPAVEDQCTDRVYRIGQTKPVHVYYPLALLPGRKEHSFDWRLHELLERKRQLSRELLLPPAATDDDTEALFRQATAV